MPELPEIITIVNILNEELKDKYILSLIYVHEKYNRISNRIFNLKVISVYYYGKKIFFLMEDGTQFYSFLSLSGLWHISPKEDLKHEKLRFTIGERKQRYTIIEKNLVFTDILNFGDFRILKKKEDFDFIIKDTGPTYLDISVELFLEFTEKHKKKEISDFLLKQKLISGIGTIYCSDSLCKSNILPYTKISEISNENLVILFNNIVELMKLSISLGGCSFQDYKNPYGENGSYNPIVYGNKNAEKYVTKTDKRKIYFFS